MNKPNKYRKADDLMAAYENGEIDRFQLYDYACKLSSFQQIILRDKYRRVEGIFLMVRLERMHENRSKIDR